LTGGLVAISYAPEVVQLFARRRFVRPAVRKRQTRSQRESMIPIKP
jgi:hypothetical protein